MNKDKDKMITVLQTRGTRDSFDGARTRIHEIRGATLLEVVLYMAFTSLTLLLAGEFMLQILSMKARIAAIEEVTQNADFAMARISMHIRSANGVLDPAIEATTPALAILEASATTTYLVDGGVLREVNAATASALTTADVVVSDLRFTNVSTANVPTAIRIQMTITPSTPNGQSPSDLGQTFYTTTVIRRTP